MAASVLDLLAEAIADAESSWSLGTFGAIAEFMRDADEPVVLARSDAAISAVTARGGIRLGAPAGLRPIAFETATQESWSQRVAFCLPKAASAMNRRAVLTELGPDAAALREQDRAAGLFDLGLGACQVDTCIRTGDADLIARLRSCAGRSLFEPGNPAMGAILAKSPHRVFITRAGRAEVYQPIPHAGATSPHGPHTHVLPKLLRSGRTHATTEPIPPGWISCAHLYPAHPLRDGYGRSLSFDAGRHAAFQHLLGTYGDADRIALKRRVLEAIAAGQGPSSVAVPGERYAHAAVRVALRQFKAANGGSPALAAWAAAYDRGERSDAEDDEQGEHAA
jgi:uncharacterized protein DUF6925